MKKAFGTFLFAMMFFVGGAFAAEDNINDPLKGLRNLSIVPKHRVGITYFAPYSEMVFNSVTGASADTLPFTKISSVTADNRHREHLHRSNDRRGGHRNKGTR